MDVHPPPAILKHILRPVYKKNRQYNKKVKRTKRQTKNNKMLHIKLRIEQHEPNSKLCVNSDAEG